MRKPTIFMLFRDLAGLGRLVVVISMLALTVGAAPVIDFLGNVTIPAGKSLIIPVTATSPNGRPLTFTATSSTNGVAVILHTNNPFWKMTVVQTAPDNAPSSFLTPFRGGVENVTNIGDMTFMLFRDIAPHTVDVVQGLTAGGLYTSNTIFHRVVANFVIQGGDPNTNGSGGPVFRYNDEFNPSAIFSGNGQLAMANSGKNTDGSQFFVTQGAQRFLDFGYTLFGQLLRGFNVLTNVINTPTNTSSRPLADVIITLTSFVPDPYDTVITLTGTNLPGEMGTISVIADDGAGGRTTNTFTAITATDMASNGQPFLYPTTITNLVAPLNTPLTNVLNGVELDGEQLSWFPEYTDQASYNTITNSTFPTSNSLYQFLTYNLTNGYGQLQILLNPPTNYSGPVTLVFVVATSPLWFYYPTQIPYDRQTYTFAFGDTPITAQAANFSAPALMAFTNQLLAIFTNGIPNSPATNFTTSINWGDNSISSGLIATNLLLEKEILGAHTYTNAGTYPVYVTIQSALGAESTVMATASVPPLLSLTSAGSNTVISWPAWATDYHLQSATNITGANWQIVSNYPVLNGYNSVVTNGAAGRSIFFRLAK
jgi:cyclophilin family peptidyl-prolyl cis-trans isomerase